MPIRVFIVVPMLNEAEVIRDTCASLGAFRESPERHFVLVDNGSSDGTWATALDIQAASVHPVHLIREEERGHVPPRRRGCLVARDYAESRGWSSDNLIICQADADTSYDENYVTEVASVMADRPGALYEGRSVLGHRDNLPASILMYLSACAQTDALVEHCFATEDRDVVVGDNVTAYHLSDYFLWGGHRREYSSGGDELLSETTRLFMRARANGAHRIRINDAVSQHSFRRVLSEPWMHFASAGFPREESWRRRYCGQLPPADLVCDAQAVRMRQQHLVGLFALLPAHVANAFDFARQADRFADFLPKRAVDVLRSTPGLLVEDVLQVIDARGDELLDVCGPKP